MFIFKVKKIYTAVDSRRAAPVSQTRPAGPPVRGSAVAIRAPTGPLGDAAPRTAAKDIQGWLPHRCCAAFDQPHRCSVGTSASPARYDTGRLPETKTR